MALHAEDALGRLCIFQIFDLSLAVPALEASRTESLVTSENGKIFYFVLTDCAAVGAIVADEGAVAQEE